MNVKTENNVDFPTVSKSRPQLAKFSSIFSGEFWDRKNGNNILFSTDTKVKCLSKCRGCDSFTICSLLFGYEEQENSIDIEVGTVGTVFTGTLVVWMLIHKGCINVMMSILQPTRVTETLLQIN